MLVDPNIVETYSAGKEGFIVALCEAINVKGLIDQALESPEGRTPDIPYGTLAMMMMVNMCDDHYPLYRLNEYYEDKDLEGIFHQPIELSQINDDRFGGFLDLMYDFGGRKMFSLMASSAFSAYGIKVTAVNFDTTSKVMWGLYETAEGTVGVVQIDFGHSKDKRSDKKQIKYGIGCANGIVVDAIVLSGNKDDKTYNTDTLERIDELLNNLNVDKASFYYIADSALFSKKNLDMAKEKSVKLITRMPDNVKLANEEIDKIVENLNGLNEITIENAKGKALKYKCMERICEYKGHPLKLAVFHSDRDKAKKKKTLRRAVKKEAETISKVKKSLSKRLFACEEDAMKEIEKLQSKDLKKVKYHEIDFSLKTKERKKRGRPSKNQEKNNVTYQYYLMFETLENTDFIDKALERACSFVLCSNDTSLDGIDLLKEYKTQDSVEKKFKQLKSPQFVNAIYLNSPKRIEAFSYLMMMCMLLLSTAEYVVRRGLENDNEQVIGPGKIKMKRPTQRAIYDMFYTVRVRVIKHPDKPWERSYARSLDESLVKIMKYLNIPLDTYIRGSG